jgi:hypothetical protein
VTHQPTERGSQQATEHRRAVVAVVFGLVCLFGLSLWPRLAGPAGSPSTSGGHASTSVDATTQTNTGAGEASSTTGSPPDTSQSPPPRYREPGGWVLVGPRSDPMADVDWPRVPYPMSCEGVPIQVGTVTLGDIDRDGRTDTVVSVHCRAGAGSPPDALFAYSGPAASPQLMATMLVPGDDVLLRSVRLAGSTVLAAGSTYSSGQVPRCCPDRHFSASWRWDGSGFVRGG